MEVLIRILRLSLETVIGLRLSVPDDHFLCYAKLVQTSLAFSLANFKLAFIPATRFLYKKPSSRPSTKSFLIFGHILVLKVS